MGHFSSGVRQQAPRILLVEDEPKVLERVKGMLEACHYEVLAADDPDQAVKLHQTEGRVDLLLTDISLPRMNGYKLSERLRAAQPTLKVLLMSGFFEDALEKYYGVNVGDQAFIHKPFNGKMLEERICELLESPDF
jgi:DNA-binding response OmpR family regulator